MRRNNILGIAASLAAGLLIAACGQNAAEATRSAIARGDDYVKNGKYSEAVLEYRKAIASDPRSGEGRRKLADAYTVVGDARNAFRETVRAADLLPNDDAVQLKAGSLLLMAKRFEDARARAEMVLERNPRSAEAQILRGNALAAMNDLDAAVKEIEQAINIDPTQANSYSNLAVIELGRGRRADAERAFRRAVEIDPKSVTARLALVVYLWTTGRAADGEQSLKEAVALDPNNELANRMLALSYLVSNRAAEAEPYLKAAAGNTADSGPKLVLASYYVATKRLDDALKVLDGIPANSSGYADAQVQRSKIRYQQGQHAEAERIVDQVLATRSGHAQALLLKSQYLNAAGRAHDAIAKAVAAVEADPQFVEGHYQLGVYYAAQGDLDAAAKSFHETLKYNPRAWPAQAQLARLHMAAGETVASLQMAQRAVTNQPNSGEARLVYARGLLATGDVARGEAQMKELLGRFPNSPNAHAQMGLAYLVRGNTPAAEAEFERALHIRPLFLDALTGLVMVDTRNNDLARAQARMDAAVAAAPRNADILMLAARTHAQRGDGVGAESLLRRAIDVNASALQAYNLLGELYRREGKLDEALRQLDAAVAKQPTLVSAHTMAATILLQQGKQDEARARYETILRIDPRAPVAANNLAWLIGEERNGDLDRAFELAKTASQALPDSPEVNDTLGWIYYKKEVAGLAASSFKRSIEKEPANPVYHYHLGLAYALAKDVSNARAALEHALKLRPDFDGAREARSTLALLAD